MSGRRAWIVRGTDTSLDWVLENNAVAINCHVTYDVTGLDHEAIAARCQAGDRRYVTELARFVNEMAVGDDVVVVSSADRSSVLVGQVAGEYVYMSEAVNGCHHRRELTSLRPIPRQAVRDVGIRLPGLAVLAVAPLDAVGLSSLLNGTTATKPAIASSSSRRPRLPAQRPQVAVDDSTRTRRLIFSRKGFDSGSGGCPSPILPDGELASLPIPEPGSGVRYADVRTPIGVTALELMRQLGLQRVRRSGAWYPLTEKAEAHVDPDLTEAALPRKPGWTPMFGQAAESASHLRTQGVEVGDLFLFFGLFRPTERTPRGLRFRPGSSAFHAIYGWMEVGEIWHPPAQPDPVPEWARRHPHVAMPDRQSNVVYVAAPKLGGLDAPGAGTFSHVDEALRLTRLHATPTQWCLPAAFRNVDLSFHASPDRWEACDRGVHLRAVSRGQEFVTTMNREIEQWARSLIASVPGAGERK